MYLIYVCKLFPPSFLLPSISYKSNVALQQRHLWSSKRVYPNNENSDPCESGQMVSERVKWAQSDVYLSQTMWNHAKISMKQLKGWLHWFPINRWRCCRGTMPLQMIAGSRLKKGNGFYYTNQLEMNNSWRFWINLRLIRWYTKGEKVAKNLKIVHV